MSQALSFNDVSLVPVPVNNNDCIWLRAADIAKAFGYQREDKVSRLYQRNADEFTPDMTQVVEISVEPHFGTDKNLSDGRCRIFSLRGCHLLAMFSRTPVAKAFRKWVLDVLDRLAEEEQATRPHGDTLTATEQAQLQAIVQAKAGMVPADMQRKAFAEMWTRFNRHFRIARYAQLPPAKMGEAVEYLVGMEVKSAMAALPSGKHEIEAATINAQFREDWPKDMKNGRKDAMKKLQAITWQLRAALDVTRIFSHPGGYSCGRTVEEKERYDILMNLYHMAEANIVSAYQALEAGYRLGREIGRG